MELHLHTEWSIIFVDEYIVYIYVLTFLATVRNIFVLAYELGIFVWVKFIMFSVKMLGIFYATMFHRLCRLCVYTVQRWDVDRDTSTKFWPYVTHYNFFRETSADTMISEIKYTISPSNSNSIPSRIFVLLSMSTHWNVTFIRKW